MRTLPASHLIPARLRPGRHLVVVSLVSVVLGTTVLWSGSAAQASPARPHYPGQRSVDLRIGGTGNALGTLRLLAEAYASTRPEVRPVVLDSIGTGGAIKGVPRGTIQIGVSSRPLTAEEAATGLVSVEYARSPTVLVVQDHNRVQGISRAQIAAIYQGRLATWPDGSRIHPLLRPGDDNTRQLKSLTPEIEHAVAAAEKLTGMVFAANAQEAADKLESTPGSFGVTTLGLIRSEKRSLRALALDGVEPSIENARAGRYPLIKQFYFIVARNAGPEIQDFVRYARSPQARKILDDTGHYLP